VALKMQALCQRTRTHGLLPAFVKIAAIGTLADVVPLVGENRVIASWGSACDEGAAPRRTALAPRRVRADGQDIDSYHIGFVLAPRGQRRRPDEFSDIAARLLLAADEAMGDEARDRALLDASLRANGKRRRSFAGQEDGRNRSRDPARERCSSLPGQAGTAASSHRRLEAGGRVPPPGVVLSIDGDVAQLVPQHPSLQSAGRTGVVRRHLDDVRRPQNRRSHSGTARVREFRARINAHADDRLGPTISATALARRTAAVQAITAGSPPSCRPWRVGAGNPSPLFSSSVEIVDGPRRVGSGI
jgi:single-stranded-DNA-specific exonuclease